MGPSLFSDRTPNRSIHGAILLCASPLEREPGFDMISTSFRIAVRIPMFGIYPWKYIIIRPGRGER